jgi:hypothetical protein
VDKGDARVFIKASGVHRQFRSEIELKQNGQCIGNGPEGTTRSQNGQMQQENMLELEARVK